MATPIWALAAAIARSADATSGRRCRTSEGTPRGTSGGVRRFTSGAMLNSGAGVPVKRRDRVLELAASPPQHIDLRQRAIEQRLLLGDVESGGGAEIVARRSEFERTPLQIDGSCQYVDFNVDFTQAEVGSRQIRRQQQPRILEIGRRLLGRRVGAFDRSLDPAEKIDSRSSRSTSRCSRPVPSRSSATE